METYIRRYDNVITSEVCDRLIKRFEDNPDQYEKHKQGEMSFTQINLLKHQDWAEDTNIIATALMEQVEKYKESCKIIGNMWPEKFTLEPLRMKRYLPDGTDQFGNHVDVNNYESARRFLVFFLYLDTNSKGSTTFPQHDITSVCEKGSVLIFPPMWPWLHAGEKPVDKPKYIIGSYLHYV
tara:strand:+ start:701 stop:1243 length:543 start_codon:yes stop_codon:yes gene_type:complete